MRNCAEGVQHITRGLLRCRRDAILHVWVYPNSLRAAGCKYLGAAGSDVETHISVVRARSDLLKWRMRQIGDVRR